MGGRRWRGRAVSRRRFWKSFRCRLHSLDLICVSVRWFSHWSVSRPFEPPSGAPIATLEPTATQRWRRHNDGATRLQGSDITNSAPQRHPKEVASPAAAPSSVTACAARRRANQPRFLFLSCRYRTRLLPLAGTRPAPAGLAPRSQPRSRNPPCRLRRQSRTPRLALGRRKAHQQLLRNLALRSL